MTSPTNDRTVGAVGPPPPPGRGEWSDDDDNEGDEEDDEDKLNEPARVLYDFAGE